MWLVVLSFGHDHHRHHHQWASLRRLLADHFDDVVASVHGVVVVADHAMGDTDWDFLESDAILRQWPAHLLLFRDTQLVALRSADPAFLRPRLTADPRIVLDHLRYLHVTLPVDDDDATAPIAWLLDVAPSVDLTIAAGPVGPTGPAGPQGPQLLEYVLTGHTQWCSADRRGPVHIRVGQDAQRRLTVRHPRDWALWYDAASDEERTAARGVAERWRERMTSSVGSAPAGEEK